MLDCLLVVRVAGRFNGKQQQQQYCRQRKACRAAVHDARAEFRVCVCVCVW